ncbi:MAG TPA: hypothetical protein VN860_03935 [Candidatus Acidoferrales bacterium]|nr:hypothetical protein [Candidatus Acidoferrales bacterium]
MARFSIERSDELILHRSDQWRDFYVLSPCVWDEDGRYHALLRVVNPSSDPAEKVSRIFYAAGRSAIEFDMDEKPTIEPGPAQDDRDGCEDPTLASRHGIYHVYYTGWNQARLEGNLLLATGRDIHNLEKRGPVFPDISRFRNPKEATIVCVPDGTWRLFFEFAEDGKSKIGVASAPKIDGPWTFGAPPFDARPQMWDCWHLSTGPVSTADPQRPVMFYNGSDRDARWRIGWIEFDSCFKEIRARSDDPIITPPAKPKRADYTDIAFANSALDEGHFVGLYYSIADRVMRRALLKRT